MGKVGKQESSNKIQLHVTFLMQLIEWPSFLLVTPMEDGMKGQYWELLLDIVGVA